MGFRTPWGTPLSERIMWRVAVDVETHCWNWLGVIAKNGYGYVRVGTNKQTYAHRVSYEAFVRPIPEGLTIDHLCRNRRCVNPEHLEAVTQRENTLRSGGIAARNAAKTECPRGHAFTADNTITAGRDGRARRCRTCANKQRRDGRLRARAVA